MRKILPAVPPRFPARSAILPRLAAGAIGIATVARRALIGALLCLTMMTGAFATDPSKEYDVKAALLYNFTQFVDWPPSSFQNDDAPLVIGIIGKDPFGGSLDGVTEHERVAGHRIVVQQCRTMAEAASSHILFIGANQRDKLPQIISGLGGKPILTVAEFDGFLNHGGMVRFYRSAENKIRVRVNLENVRHGGITMSAKLLRVVEVVPANEE